MWILLYFSWERTIISLIVPFSYPFIRTERLVNSLEIFTWFIIFALDLVTAMVINVILPAIPWEINIKLNGEFWSENFIYLVWFWLGNRASNGAVLISIASEVDIWYRKKIIKNSYWIINFFNWMYISRS